MAWGKKGDKPVKALPAPESEQIEKKLAEKFKDAKKGVYCRTLAFKDSDLDMQGCEWFEAHRVGHNHWVVLRRRQSESLPADDGIIVRQDIVKGCEYLPMIEAITKLAAYESAQVKSGLLTVTQGDLGAVHYKIFALREGLGFDVDNVPRPTAEGRIVTPGKFAKEAFNDVQDAVSAAQEEARRETSKILQETLLDGISAQEVSAASFNDYMFAWRMLGVLKILKETLALGTAHGFMPRKDLFLSDGTAVGHNLKSILDHRAFGCAKIAIDDYHPDSVNIAGVALRKLAVQTMEIAAFYSCYVMLQRMMLDMQNPAGVSPYDFSRMLAEAEQRLTGLGGSEADVKSIRASLMRPNNDLTALPKGLDRMIARFEGICQAMRDAKPLMDQVDPPRRLLFPDNLKL